jgi:hypothetical protein
VEKVVNRACENCGRTFSIYPSRARGRNGRFCALACFHAKNYADPGHARFWSKVDRSGDCWLWTATRRADGYGQFRHAGEMHGAHRFSYEIERGPIPGGLMVLHRCDNPPCVNPAHLFLGTGVDNARDMVEKGRSLAGARAPSHLHPERLPRGADHPRARLTDSDVLMLRAAPRRTLSSIARRLGVCTATVWAAASGKTWKHLPLVRSEGRR